MKLEQSFLRWNRVWTRKCSIVELGAVENAQSKYPISTNLPESKSTGVGGVAGWRWTFRAQQGRRSAEIRRVRDGGRSGPLHTPATVRGMQ